MYLDLKNSSQKKIGFPKGIILHIILHPASQFIAPGFYSYVIFLLKVIAQLFKKGVICLCTISFTAYADALPDKVFIQNQVKPAPQNHPNPLHKNSSFSEADLTMMRQVIQSAYTFMTPRLIYPHTPQELTLWGLNILITRDPDLSITEITSAPLTDDKKTELPLNQTSLHKLIALRGNKLIADTNYPAELDYEGWATLAVSIIQKEWEDCPSVQSLGKEQLLSLFFAEISRHLDPYSRYLLPDMAQKERAIRHGINYSLGLTLDKKPGYHYPVIDKINANSLLWAAGADHGQKIYKINNHNAARLSLDTINSLTVREEPDTVSVKYGRSRAKAKSVKVLLERLAPQTVSAIRYTNRYLLLQVTDFSTQTADEVSQLLSDALPLKGVILDLRGNKGGVLQQAVMTAALFLDHGIVATTIGRNPAANHVWAVQGGDITNNAPLVILVDGHTASAAEVLAAALADHHRAVIIGSATYGKGLVQDIGQMPNGGEIFVTWSRNTAPLGEPIQILGVIPQICTSMSPPTTNEQLFALKQGHSLLANLIAQSRSTRSDTPHESLMKIRENCLPNHEKSEELKTALRVLISPIMYKTALESVPSMTDAPP